MKKKYIKPTLEDFLYLPEEGYAATVAMKDYVIVEGTDRQSMRTADEVSEFTSYDEETGEWEYTTGEWEL